MRYFKAKYMFKNPDGYSRFITEIINAKGIMHAHKLANDHAKVLNAHIDALNEITKKNEIDAIKAVKQ